MEIVQSVISFVQAHWVEILAAIGALDVLLGVVSKMTPWAWDDSVYTILHNLVGKFGAKK